MKNIKYYLLCLLISGKLNVHAQEIVATLEAELGQITLPAKVKPLDGSLVTGLSGGKYVGDNDPGSSIIFTNVNAPEKGTYVFKTYYLSAQHRSIAIKVNNYPEYISSIVNPTIDWNEPPVGEMSTYVYLDKGENTIKITPHPNGHGGPNLDKFEIITTDYVLPEPGQFPIILEAESAQLFGDLKIKPIDGSSVSGLSGGKYIGDFHLSANSHLRFNNIEIPEEGTYELKIFSMGSSRPLTIKANQYKKTVVRTNISPDWNNAPTSVVSTLIYLDKGLNRLAIGLHEDDGPNLDKFEIHKTDQIIEKPLIDNLSFHFDHTDEAEMIAEHPNTTLQYLTDNDEYTAYVPGDVSSTSIIAVCKQPILLTGFLLSGGVKSEQNILSWRVFQSKDGNIWNEITANKNTDLDGAYFFEVNRSAFNAAEHAAQYYKLEVNGDEISIAEWQLFGIPYITNTDGRNFPVDITSDIAIVENTSAYPEGASGDNWSERFYNVFDRNMSTKYYCHQAQQFYIEINLDEPSKLSHYTLTSCADFPDRDPKKWTLNAFNDDLGWVELDRQVDYTFPCRYATMKFETNSDQFFTKFLIDVESNNGGGDIQLLKWQLFGEESVSSTPNNIFDESVIFVSGHNHIKIIRKESNTIVFSIFDLTGVRIRQGKINATQQIIPLERGIYLISLSQKDQIKTKKIIVN